MWNVALLPSVSAGEGAGGCVEGVAMRLVADGVRALLLEVSGREVEVFWPGIETAARDAARRQAVAAETWLRARPGPAERKLWLGLRTHGDAAGGVRALHLPEAPRAAPSRALAGCVAAQLRGVLGGRRERVGPLPEDEDPRWAALPGVGAVVLCGSPLQRRELRALREEPELLAEGVALGIEEHIRREGARRARGGVVWTPGRLRLGGGGAVSRTAPTRGGRVLHALGPAEVRTAGYTETGQRVAGTTLWYHLAREHGYGWVHASAGRYVEGDGMHHRDHGDHRGRGEG